ncbi:MAG: M56 family metallopeptidase [Acutalibacteraceae bacterium]
MSEIFLKIVNMSLSASWIVLAVLLLRLPLKKAPKWITVLLWGMVAVRLICPFSVQSAMSLIPSAETISPEIMTAQTPEINTGIPMVNNTINPILRQSAVASQQASANPLQIWIPILALVWLVGMTILFAYTAIRYWRMRRKIGTAVKLRDNVYQSEAVSSPFVLGMLKPKIYLPFSMREQDMPHVIAHERSHIRRRDHWWKALGFLLLTIHWFNPLLWLGYALFCTDIELACDEKTVKHMETAQRADYAQALLTCSVRRPSIAACPLAFGEVGVKDRVKSVLQYKKPAFWIIVLAVAVSALAAVCFLTNPADGNAPAATDNWTDNTDDVPSRTEVPLDRLQEKYPLYFDLPVSDGLAVYIWQMGEGNYSCVLLPGKDRNYTWEDLWDLHKSATTMEEMKGIAAAYLSAGVSQSDVVLRPIQMPHSSYFYEINDAYLEKLNDLFWSDFPAS